MTIAGFNIVDQVQISQELKYIKLENSNNWSI